MALQDLIYNLGGGLDQAQIGLGATDLAQRMELGRRDVGTQLLDYLTNIQQSPFSIVPAMQAYGAAGGGPLAPGAAFAQTGGAGMPSPYGELAERLLQGLSEFAGGAPINPLTGRPFTPNEMAYLRIIEARERAGQEQPTQQQTTLPTPGPPAPKQPTATPPLQGYPMPVFRHDVEPPTAALPAQPAPSKLPPELEEAISQFGKGTNIFDIIDTAYRTSREPTPRTFLPVPLREALNKPTREARFARRTSPLLSLGNLR